MSATRGQAFPTHFLKTFLESEALFHRQVSIYIQTKSQCAGQMGRAQVRLRGQIPGVDKRRQNASAEPSRAARR